MMFEALKKELKDTQSSEEPDRYVTTYDYPVYPEKGTDSVIETLNKIGSVKTVECAPATTIGFTANAGQTHESVCRAVRTALDENESNRKAVVTCIGVQAGAWAWPQKDTVEERNKHSWKRIF